MRYSRKRMGVTIAITAPKRPNRRKLLLLANLFLSAHDSFVPKLFRYAHLLCCADHVWSALTTRVSYAAPSPFSDNRLEVLANTLVVLTRRAEKRGLRELVRQTGLLLRQKTTLFGRQQNLCVSRVATAT